MSAAYRLTTNNRMELLAVIVALESLKKDNVQIQIYTDSKYVVEAVEKKWVFGWVKKNFKDKKNEDLWLRFLALYAKHHIKFHWVKGHASNAENNRCDELATQAADSGPYLVDQWYEENSKV
jgi:ribonuclease HI